MTDGHNHYIQKFTPDGQFITAIGREGSKHLKFDCPRGIAINTVNKKLYITDYFNHRLQIPPVALVVVAVAVESLTCPQT